MYCEQQQQHQQQQQDQDQQLSWVVTLLKLILFVQKSLKACLTLFCCEEHNWHGSGMEDICLDSFQDAVEIQRRGDTSKTVRASKSQNWNMGNTKEMEEKRIIGYVGGNLEKTVETKTLF